MTKNGSAIWARRTVFHSVQSLLASAQRLSEHKILNQVQNDGMRRFFRNNQGYHSRQDLSEVSTLSSRTCFGMVSILSKYGSEVLTKYGTTILAGQQRTALCSVQRLLASAQRLLEEDMGV
ncbi:hypothetical protein Y696_04625 [Mesotoga sp. H07pep.5.4]|nr:hypothetical protein Y696_04625 [Mesotoga sp. H07pep.5.4]